MQLPPGTLFSEATDTQLAEHLRAALVSANGALAALSKRPGIAARVAAFDSVTMEAERTVRLSCGLTRTVNGVDTFEELT